MEASSRVILRKRHVWQEPWSQPRFSITLQPGQSATMIDRYANGGYGILTSLGVQWVAAGPNGDLFYYNWFMDGELREKILRIIGTGANSASFTGVSTPEPIDPPEAFNQHMQIVAFNNDTVAHVAEVIARGYNIYRRPDTKDNGLGF